MEKKTIGSFISVLRRANGMTQAELAEKLFVSDKTVSRWERDESAPDLTLLPIIADLFGVTCIAPVGEWHAVRNSDGEIIATFFWSNASVYSYRTSFNRYTVYEYSEYERAQTLYNAIDNGLFVLAVANVATFIIVYNIKKRKLK